MWAYVPLHCIMGESSTVSLYYGKYLCVSSVGEVPLYHGVPENTSVFWVPKD